MSFVLRKRYRRHRTHITARWWLRFWWRWWWRRRWRRWRCVDGSVNSIEVCHISCAIIIFTLALTGDPKTRWCATNWRGGFVCGITVLQCVSRNVDASLQWYDNILQNIAIWTNQYDTNGSSLVQRNQIIKLHIAYVFKNAGRLFPENKSPDNRTLYVSNGIIIRSCDPQYLQLTISRITCTL